jgi:hypothetical protein
LNFFAAGHCAGTGGLDFNKRIFHFSDHEFDQFFGIFRFVENGIDVGANDVAKACKNTHDDPPV